MATFSYDPGNVWTNLELACQHADQQIVLHPGQNADYEVKTLVMRGTLEQVLAKLEQHRPGLRH